MLYNLHTHSRYCGHGSGEIMDYLSYASGKGFSFLGFSEHCPFPTGRFRSTRMPYSEMEKYENDVRSSASGFSFPVLLGYEIDYMEQWHDYFRSVRERVDYFTAGVHFVERPDGTFRTPFNDGFSDDDVRRYAEQVVKVMESGLVSFLAHPDVFLCRRHFDSVTEETSRMIASASASLSVPLEINGNGMLKDSEGYEGYPSGNFWRIASEYVDAAVISTDAHTVSNLDRTIPYVRAFAEKAGIAVLEPYVSDGGLSFRKEPQS